MRVWYTTVVRQHLLIGSAAVCGRAAVLLRPLERGAMATDYSIPLKNVRREKFVLNLFAGMSQSRAYVEAGYASGNEDVSGHRLAKTEEVKGRLLYLREEMAAEGIMTANEVVKGLSDLARTASDRERIVALNSLMKYYGLHTERVDMTTKGESMEPIQIYLPDNGRDSDE